MGMNNVLEEAIKTYGENAQLDMCVEEMSELIKEICKKKRGFNNSEAIREELADVYIVLRQLEMMCGFTLADIAEVQHMKLERLEKNLRAQRGH